jgi:hypothetical protein
VSLFCAAWFVVLPICIGLFSHVCAVALLRSPLEKRVIFGLWHAWALGLALLKVSVPRSQMWCKCFCASSKLFICLN